jgi:hypothetical protein
MRYASQRLVRDTFSALKRADREALFDQRRLGNPIFSLEEPPPIRDIHVEWQIWADLHVGYSAMYDLERLKSFKWNVCAAVASALSDALYWERPLHDRPRGDFHIKLLQSDIQLLRCRGMGLTSRSLFEAIALVDELLAWGIPREGATARSELEAHYRQMLDTSYGTPHNVFATFGGSRERSPVQEAVTLACLADFALNPPLPPYVDIDQDVPFYWPDIYPPSRFVRACQAMQREDLLSSDPSDDEIREYVALVSELSGLPNPFAYSSRDLSLDDAALARPFRFESLIVGSNDHDQVKGDYIAFLDWAARRLWKLRLSEPGLLLLHGQRFVRPERRGKAELLLDVAGAGWFTAPFEKTPNGNVGFSPHIVAEVAVQFMASLGLYLSMHKLACRTGPFSVDDFPSIPTMRNRWEEVRLAVNSIMQHQIW